MSGTLDWLMGIGELRPGDPGVHFAMTFDLAPWQWALLAMAAVVAGAWCYRKLEGPLWWRAVLAGTRALVLMILLFLAAGPKLVRTTETIEKDWVLVLVDRSSSMRIADAPAGPGSGNGGGSVSASLRHITRDAQVRQLLGAGKPAWDAIARDRIIAWLGFDSGAFDLKPSASGDASPVALDEPNGRRTNLAAAIEQALARAAARPISGIVVFSDGRATDQIPRTLMRRLAAERIGVYTVALGNTQPLADLSVRSVQGPGVAFANDHVPVEVVVERSGGPVSVGASTVQLIDSVTGAVLDQRMVDWNAPDSTSQAAPKEPDASRPQPEQTRRLTLAGSPTSAGRANWIVKITSPTPDLLPENDSLPVNIELTDRPLRVLYLDGYPRWEYRYLKNLLSREKSLSFGAMLIAAGRRYIQEGSEPIDAIPASPGEWEKYDVIVMGDVRPDVFSSDQVEQIKRRVATGGAGLLWIAGPSSVPEAWRQTAMLDLVPFSLGGAAEIGLRTWDRDVTVSPTPLAQRLGVLRLADPAPNSENYVTWPPAVSDPASGWSHLRWAQRIDAAALKPAAEVLATAAPVSGGNEPPSPLVMSMRYGAGRVIYVATDEIWRWRYGRGEDLPERFWIQLVRLLGRDSVARAGRPAVLEFSPSRGEVGQAVRVSVQLVDQSLVEAAPSSINVSIARSIRDATSTESPGAVVDQEAITLTLRPSGAQSKEGAARRWYSATWVPNRTGNFRGTVTDSLLSTSTTPITAEAEVWLPDDELRHPDTDHALLAELSRSSGGETVRPVDIANLAERLPRREIRQAGITDEHTLWDKPIGLIALLVLLAIEWIGRRLIRLV